MMKDPGTSAYRGNLLIPIHDDNPTVIKPWVTYALIAVNVVVFVWQYSLPPETIAATAYQLGVIPAVLLGTDTLPADLAIVPAWTTLITSMFMHGGLLHLGGNMLYLWIFGNNVEDAMGHTRFLVFYLLTGFAASALQIAMDPDSTIPVIGASGAISGVLGAYLLLYPHAIIKMLVPIFIIIRVFKIRAVWVLGIYFLLQIGGVISSGLTPEDEGGGIAYGAHLGGFIAGVLLIGFFKSNGFRIHNPLSAFSRQSVLDQPVARPVTDTPHVDDGMIDAAAANEPAPETLAASNDELTRDQNQQNLGAHQKSSVRNVDADDLADPDNLDDYSRDRNRLTDLE